MSELQELMADALETDKHVIETLTAENKALRAENDELRKAASDGAQYLLDCKNEWRDWASELARDNAELRELVRDMWRFTGAACKKYPRLFDPSAQGGQMVQLNMLDSFEQRMAELGITEVD